MKVLIKILKIILGIVLGLVFSLLTVFCLDYFLLEDLFLRSMVSLWLIALIVAIWVFFMLWLLLLRKPSAKNIHSRGFDKLPLSVSEFIDGVIIAMKYRRSVRADVRQELTDHFTDALADCETEEEKQKATQELIEAFGDIELLGKLLRRAKKRCRPLWRTMVVRTYQFIGVCFLLLILYIGWFFTGKPQITTNYLEVMKQQVRPVADDSQNAWPYYKQAAEKYIEYKQPEDKDQRVDFSPQFIRKLSEQNWKVIQQSVRDNSESLNLIRQGNQKPYYWRNYGVYDSDHPQLISMLLPHLNEFKKLTYLMCWQGLLSAEQVNYKEAINTAIEVYSFGDHLRGQNTTLIEQLVAMSIEGTARKTMLILLTEYGEQIDVQTMDSARKQFAEMIENKDFTINYEFEKMFMYDEAQRCFTQSRFGKSHLYLPRLKGLGAFENIELLEIANKDGAAFWIKGGLHVLFTHPDKEQTLREAERLYGEMEKIAAMTPASANAERLDMHVFTDEEIRENVFLSILMPALSRVNQIGWRNFAQSEAALVIMALIQHEKQHGEYPESLDMLVEKGLLKEVPVDPFSDKSIIYRRTDDDFILYSVGFNFTDDGGTRIKDRKGNLLNWRYEGDGIFWPVESVDGPQ